MAIIKPSAITKPFCNSGDKVSPPNGADTYKANQETGFPNSQSVALPLGTPVERDEMNGLLNLYTQFILWLTAGGQPTFEQSISDQNGGYPAGIILYNNSNHTFQRSLIDNNTANFITTPSYLNDIIHWRQLNYVSAVNLHPTVTTWDQSIPIAGASSNVILKKTALDNNQLFCFEVSGSIIYPRVTGTNKFAIGFNDVLSNVTIAGFVSCGFLGSFLDGGVVSIHNETSDLLFEIQATSPAGDAQVFFNIMFTGLGN